MTISKLLRWHRAFTTSPALPEHGIFMKKLASVMADPLKHAQASAQQNPNIQAILQMDQANGREYSRILRRFAVQYFARFPTDTGSAEVQIALSTVRMELLKRHVGNGNNHDYKSKRLAVQVEHERKAMLKYLRQSSLERYYAMLDRLGLPMTYLDRLEAPYAQYRYRLSRKMKPVQKQFKEKAHRTLRGLD